MSISSDDPRNVDEGEILTGNLDNLIERISGPPMSEIDWLVSDLQAWRQHVEYEGERVQRTIAEFAQLNQSSASAIAEAIEEMKRAADLRGRLRGQIGANSAVKNPRGAAPCPAVAGLPAGDADLQ